MQMRHRAALDGVQLDSVDNRIMISRIETGDGKENISTVSLAGEGFGSRVTSIHRDLIDVTVKFRIRLKKRDMAERELVLEKANAWALNGGWLTTNYKTGRRIRVFRAQAATAGDPWDWTREYAIVFRACGVPYWQESTASSATASGSSGTVSLAVGGSEKTVMNAQFTNSSSSTCDNFSISTPESTISFSSLGLASGETLVIDHYDRGTRCNLRLRIRNTGNNYRSVYDKRTGDDDLILTPGTRSIEFSAQRSGSLTASCYGRFA